MNLTTLIITIAVIVMIAGVSLAFVMVSRKQEPKRRPVAGPDLGPLDPRLADSIQYSSKYTPKGKNTPASITILPVYPFPAPIKFSAESGMERFGKAIGLSSEVQTGDQLFDDAIYVDSPYPEYAAAMLADRDNRNAIRRCFAATPNLSRIECRRDGTRFTLSPVEYKQPPQDLALELLAALPGLRQTVSRQEIKPNKLVEKIGLSVIIATVILSILGFTALAIGLGAYQTLDGGIFIPSLQIGLIGWLAWTILAYLVLRGRSETLVAFLLAAILGLGDFIVLGIGTVHIANGVTATAPVVAHSVPVTGKHISRGKNSTSYYLEFTPWREGMDDSLRVAYSWYEAYNAGNTLVIDSQIGGLGYEMLIGYRE